MVDVGVLEFLKWPNEVFLHNFTGNEDSTNSVRVSDRSGLI